MQMGWLRWLTGRRGVYVWLALASLALLAVYASMWAFGSGVNKTMLSDLQAYGTAAMFAIHPVYFLGAMVFQATRAQALTETFASTPRIDAFRERIFRMPVWTPAVIVLGALLGAQQNIRLIQYMTSKGEYGMADVVFVVGNIMVWAAVGLLLTWRIRLSLALSQVGNAVQIDLLDFSNIIPIRKLATTDVLIVMGALSFMALQSLDAQFRLSNYVWGMLAGVPSALILFLTPLWGLRRNITRQKAARLEVLGEELREVPRDDTQRLELVSAHIDRVRQIPSWPIDVRLVTRIISYIIIPPLAWVGAAIVEGYVQGPD